MFAVPLVLLSYIRTFYVKHPNRTGTADIINVLSQTAPGNPFRTNCLTHRTNCPQFKKHRAHSGGSGPCVQLPLFTCLWEADLEFEAARIGPDGQFASPFFHGVLNTLQPKTVERRIRLGSNRQSILHFQGFLQRIFLMNEHHTVNGTNAQTDPPLLWWQPFHIANGIVQNVSEESEGINGVQLC